MQRSEGPLPLLVFTTVFPNAVQPHHGAFVAQRLRGLLAAAPETTARVVAPSPWFPFASRLRPAARPKLPRREVRDGVEVEHPRFFSLPLVGKCLDGAFLALGALPRLLRLRRQGFAFVAIDAHFAYPDGLAAVLLGRLLRVPVVLTLRGTELLLAPRRLRRPQMAWALRRAARVIAVSPELAALARELGVPDERLRLIPNGVDAELFRPTGRAAARRELGLPEEAPILLTVGSLGERKGIHLVLEALAALAGRFPGLRYLVVGGEGPEGAWGGELRRRAEDLGVAGRVLFAGPRRRRELPAWYNAADLFLLPSSLEGSPNAVLEALACGTPVAATPVGTLPELLAEPGAGLLIERRDAAAVAEAVTAALERPWDRDRVRDRVAARTWEAVGAEVAAELHAVLGGRPVAIGSVRRGDRPDEAEPGRYAAPRPEEVLP